MIDASRPTTTYVDVTDLLVYLRVHETVSDIQRLQCEILRGAVEVSGAESICFVVLDDARALGSVETAALLDLIQLALSGSAARLVVDHKLSALFARVVPPFIRPHDLFLFPRCLLVRQWGGEPAARIEECRRDGGNLHARLSVRHRPGIRDVPETRRVIKGVVEALTFADFIVTTSEDKQASIAEYLAARHLPPLPVDVVPLAHELSRSRPWRAVAKEVLRSARALARRVPPFDGVAAITLPANRYLPITSDACEDGELSANLACISGWKWPESWGVWADQRTAILGFRTDLPVGTRSVPCCV